MIELLLKSSFTIGIAFLFYKLLLQQESFFATNRLYLLACLALAFALPFVTLPKLIDHQGYFFRALNLESTSDIALSSAETGAPETPSTISIQEQRHAVKAESQKLPENKGQQTAALETENTSSSEFSWGFWLLMLYLFGVAVFACTLLFQVGSIFYRIYTSSDKITDGDFVIVNLTHRHAPCSFFRYIFIYPEDYDYETYEQIIAHEKIHARLGHSLDLLLAEIAVVILWFNPFVWLFKKEIEKNNEYQTDALLLEKEQVRKEQYQLNLLQIAVPNKPLSITTNYNQSLLKQRIMMMNAKRSTAHAYWKYAFLAPLFFGALLFMNEPAQSRDPERKISVLDPFSEGSSEDATAEKQSLPANPPAPAEVPNPPVPAVADPGPAPYPGPAVAQNDQGSDNKKDKVKAKAGKKKGYSFNVSGRADMSEGYFYSSREGNEYCISFKGSNKSNSHWNMSDCFDTRLFQKQGNDVFVVNKETGILQLNGNLDSEVGQGKYKFTESSDFRKYLDKNNITGIDKNSMFLLFFGDVDKKYVDFLKKNYSDINGDRLEELAVHGITMQQFQEYLALYQKHGNKKPSVQDIIAARIHGIDQAYIKELQSIGYKDLSIKKMMEAKIHGVDAAYVDGLRKAGFKDLSMDKIIAAKIHGVTPASVKEVKALGFGELDIDKIMQLNIHGVDEDYIKEMRAAGLKDLTMDQYLQAKIHGLDAASVKDIRAMGYKDADFDDMISAKIHGVDKAYLDDLKKAGFADISLNKAAEAKIHGINSGFIQKARKNGYNLNSLDKYIALKIHGMAMESLKEKE